MSISTEIDDIIKASSLGDIISRYVTEVTDRIAIESKTPGKHKLKIELPTVFPSENIDRKTSQTIVYATLIDSLEQPDRDIKLLLSGEGDHAKTIIIIRWETKISEAILRRLEQTIQSHEAEDSGSD